MITEFNAEYDTESGMVTDSSGRKWVRLKESVYSMDKLIELASSCSHLPSLMDAVEKEMLKAFEEGESK